MKTVPYRYCIQNIIGDEAERVIQVPEGRNPKRYAIGAISAARKILPKEEPFVLMWFEQDGKPTTRIDCFPE